jgi:hypothetical protein
VRQLEHLGHELRGVAAHESVIGISRDFEVHEATVGRTPCFPVGCAIGRSPASVSRRRSRH